MTDIYEKNTKDLQQWQNKPEDNNWVAMKQREKAHMAVEASHVLLTGLLTCDAVTLSVYTLSM